MVVHDKQDLYFLDTNIFLRTLIKEDEKTFAECIALFKLLEDGQIQAYTNILVIAEINFVLSSYYKFPKQKVATALESIVQTPKLKIVDDLDAAWGISLFAKENIKFIDCLLASSEFLRNKKACVISYDSDFKRLDVKYHHPKDIIKNCR